MLPSNYSQLVTGRARRSVLTLHRRIQRDLLRQVYRRLSGRYAWYPALRPQKVTQHDAQ